MTIKLPIPVLAVLALAVACDPATARGHSGGSRSSGSRSTHSAGAGAAASHSWHSPPAVARVAPRPFVPRFVPRPVLRPWPLVGLGAYSSLPGYAAPIPYPLLPVPYYQASVESAPPVYIEKDMPNPVDGLWYFCPASGIYFPYVSECAVNWQALEPSPPPEG